MNHVEINGLEPFVGKHCETVATGTLLRAAGLELSEPMLFGLGEGLGFIFVNLNTLPLPFIGGRVKPFELTASLCRNLGVRCQSSETASKAKAWAQVEEPLRRGQPVGLQLDCYYLEYFVIPFHFAGHFVAAVGFDDVNVSLVDTSQQGTRQRVRRSNLEAARFAKGPMAARARSWTVAKEKRPTALSTAIRSAIRNNAAAYLSPSFQGMSHLGIRKLAASLPKWLRWTEKPERDLGRAALLMERAGTGGAVFRNFYRDFLSEAKQVLPQERGLLEEGRALFSDSANEWTVVADRIEKAGATGDVHLLEDAAQRCNHIAELEVSAMRLLVNMKP